MAEKTNNSRTKLKRFIFKALIATVKATLFYAVYFVLWIFLDPVSSVFPNLHMIVETFVVVYIVLMIIGDFTSGTIFQHFFNTAKALFVICYLLISMQGGIMTITFQNVNLMVDLRIFLAVATILGLLGFAKSIVQVISYMNERAELSIPI